MVLHTAEGSRFLVRKESGRLSAAFAFGSTFALARIAPARLSAAPDMSYNRTSD
jgi:hypothetical protein